MAFVDRKGLKISDQATPGEGGQALQDNFTFIGDRLELAEPKQVRIDQEGGLTYIGKAEPASATSAPVWQISRLDESALPDVTLLWADGDSAYNNVWDSRLGLSYS